MPLLDQWRRTESMCFTATDGETVQEYRFTFVTMSAFEEAKYSRYRSLALVLLNGMYGDLSEVKGDAVDDLNAYLNIFIKHAAVKSACSKVEVRTLTEVPPTDEAAEPTTVASEWEVVPFPEIWADPMSAAQNMPGHILNELCDTVLMAGNPGRLLGFSVMSEEEKKMIRINAKPSAA
jgi:hypothetical protein